MAACARHHDFSAVGQLTAEQLTAARRALEKGENLFFSGAAGTGKSFLLRFLVQEFQRRLIGRGQVVVTAPTGIAAANVGGQTTHSFAGVGLGTERGRKLLKQVRMNRGAVQRWRSAVVLIIDEVSMLDGELFEELSSIAASIRACRKPFGGLQLILCGDFLQLPPVQVCGELHKRFAFQTNAWKRCGLQRGTILLREPLRQAGDNAFISLLNEVRLGVVSALTDDTLAACSTSRKPLPTDGIVPTKLYCLNKNVDTENKNRLSLLQGDACLFQARDHFSSDVREDDKNHLRQLVEKRVAQDLWLKANAQVVLVKNQSLHGLVNGSRGIVECFQDGQPVVRFDNGVTVAVGRDSFEVGGPGPWALMVRSQVPLKLAWALTVHRAQGMTLSRAELKLDDAFVVGQAYVALSRLTSLAGLWIRGGGISRTRPHAHPDVLMFYADVPRAHSPSVGGKRKALKRKTSSSSTQKTLNKWVCQKQSPAQ